MQLTVSESVLSKCSDRLSIPVFLYLNQIETRGATVFVMEMARILGKEDCGVITPQRSRLTEAADSCSKIVHGQTGKNTHKLTKKSNDKICDCQIKC